MKEVVAEIFKDMDQKLISEDVKTKVAEMINNVVNARVDAKTSEVIGTSKKLEEDNKKLSSEIEVLKKDIIEKEEFLKEAARDFGKQLNEQFAEKEAILFETVKEYQAEAVNVLKETATEYRSALESEALSTAEEYKTFVESVVLEESAEFKKMRQTSDAEMLNKFKEELLEKADEYIRAELKKNIPEKIMEDAASAAALKPLVENMINVIEKHGLAIDKSGSEILKAAQKNNAKLSEAFNVKVTENVKLEARVKSLEKAVKLTQLTEGMTPAQKAKAVKLLESCSVDEVDSKFKAIKDIIISESVAKPRIVNASEVAKNGEAVKAQVSRIVESVTKPSGPTTEMDSWKNTLDAYRRQ